MTIIGVHIYLIKKIDYDKSLYKKNKINIFTALTANICKFGEVRI